MTDGTRDTRAVTWASTGEAAQVLGVSIRTLYRKIAAGEVPVRKQKGRTLVGIAAGSDTSATDTGNDSIPGAGTPHERQRRMTPEKVGFDPVRHVREKIRAEEERLTLRRIRQAHKALTEEEKEAKRMAKEEKKAEAEAKQQEEERRLQEERARAEARERARLEAEQRRRREEAEQQRQQKRREIIQRAKDYALSWSVDGVSISEEIRAQARAEIERALADLPIQELPEREVQELAEGVWRRVTRPVVQAAEEAKKREKAAREEEARQREAQRQAKETAVKRGLRYAEGELEEIPGLDSLKKGFWLVDVRFGLDRTLTGTEAPDAIEAAVDEILRPKIRDLERQRREAEEREARRKKEEADREREARKRELIRHGEGYARDELEDLEPGDRWTIPPKVREALQAELDGTEDEEDVEDLVDELIDRELR